MDMVEQEYDGFPLHYVAALAGFVAAVCPMMVVTAFVASGPADWWRGGLLLVPVCLAAVIVMILIGPALDTLIRESGRTSRWLYVAGTSIIIGVCCLLLVLLLFMSKDVKFAPLIGVASLVPIASVPSGLLFHYLVQPARSIPPVDRRDALIIGTWIAAWILLIVSMAGMGAVPRSDPHYARIEAVGLFSIYGIPALMLGGIAAGFARLWNLRLGTVIAGLAWLVPAWFAIGIYLTPLGPEKLHFVVAGHAFDIDWHLRPRQQGMGFCFDASGLGLYAERHRPINPNICLSEITGPLAAVIPSVAGDHRWIEAGLSCEEVFVTQRVGQRVGKVCSATDAAGHTTVLIECPPGYCFQRFDDHGLRYSIHLIPEDFNAWGMLQERALRLGTEVSTAPTKAPTP